MRGLLRIRVRPGALEVAMSRSLARATGACGLAHVVLLLAGFANAVPAVTWDSSPAELTHPMTYDAWEEPYGVLGRLGDRLAASTHPGNSRHRCP